MMRPAPEGEYCADCAMKPFWRFFLGEHKTFASMKVTVESRAHTVQRDLKERAENLHSRHPG